MFNCVYKDGGREYPQFDCYGLVMYMYKEMHNIDIPDFIYDKSDDKENEKFYYESLKNGVFTEVAPQKGVIVALRVNGYVSHVGIMLSDTEFMHIMEKSGVRINKVTQPQWKNRVVGYYKYA